MNPEKYKKIAELFGEGFFADRVIAESDKKSVRQYGYRIIEGRSALDAEKMSLKLLLSINHYVRFLAWIREEHGKKEFKSDAEAQTFLAERINDLLYFREGWKDFFKWLQKKTLDEISRLVYR